MASLRDILSDQDKQKMGVVKHSNPNAKTSNNKHYVQPTQNDLVFVERRRRISCPSDNKTLHLSDIKNTSNPSDNTLIHKFRSFCDSIFTNNPQKITSDQLYDFFYKLPNVTSYLINLKDVQVYRIIINDERFKDILDKYCYKIFNNLPDVNKNLKEKIIDRYPLGMYVYAHDKGLTETLDYIEQKYASYLYFEFLKTNHNDIANKLLQKYYLQIFNKISEENVKEYLPTIYLNAYKNKFTSALEYIEPLYPSYLYVKLLENNQPNIASKLLPKYYFQIFNDVKKSNNHKIFIDVLGQCYTAYTWSRGTTNPTSKQIENNIYDIFTQTIDNALPVAEKIVTDKTLYDGLYESIISHDFNKYSEAFFQFDSTRFLQLEISKPVTKPKFIEPEPVQISKIVEESKQSNQAASTRPASVWTKPKYGSKLEELQEQKSWATENWD
ncbi:MAG: hypothetical protein J6W27_02150 [Alphaproteobacteria bacterium]|nr:hypothetical protein [Alphaproteobacteria bacterium]